MSGWAKQTPTTGGGSGPGGILDKIPGYSGYRAKERRRDEDKQVRLELAARYDQIAGRLGALQGELVGAQRFAEIGAVERTEKALRLFIDRLRTATYGYGGLFSERSIDERALDQIAAFDRALGDGVDALRGAVEAVAAAIGSGDDLPGKVRAVQTQLDALNRRFELRGQAVESGEALSQAAVGDLFTGTEEERPHPADDLHFGDAVAIGGTDYIVKGRMEFHGGETAWRQYLLRDGAAEAWLHVPPTTAEPMALLRAVGAVPEGDSVAVEGTAYTASASGDATAEVIGEAGKQSGRRARFRRYTGDAGALLFTYDWGADERQALAGHTLDPLEVKVYAL